MPKAKKYKYVVVICNKSKIKIPVYTENKLVKKFPNPIKPNLSFPSLLNFIQSKFGGHLCPLEPLSLLEFLFIPGLQYESGMVRSSFVTNSAGTPITSKDNDKLFCWIVD